MGARCTEIYRRMVPRGTITKLRNFHWSLPRSADSTGKKMSLFRVDPRRTVLRLSATGPLVWESRAVGLIG